MPNRPVAVYVPRESASLVRTFAASQQPLVEVAGHARDRLTDAYADVGAAAVPSDHDRSSTGPTKEEGP